MKISIVGCLFVLDSIKSEYIKKNDTKVLNVVLNKETKELINIDLDGKSDVKELIREKIASIIGSNKFHLEQVYTLGESKYYDDNRIDIIYMALTNSENIKKMDAKYELVPFNLKDNNIELGNEAFKFKTKEKVKNNNIEYYHEVKSDDLKIEKKLIELLTVYKYLRFRIDNTDVCFKLLPELFSLEDVRILYEMIKNTNVDKSNFRKKILKFCEKTDVIIGDKGYRPTQMYKFNPENNDLWL